MKLNTVWEGFLDMLFPPREICPLCSMKNDGGKICVECTAWLEEYNSLPVCRICGRFMDWPATPICPFCSIQRPSFDRARAVAPYRGVLREAVLHLKSKGTKRVTRGLAELMVGIAGEERDFARAEMIIPVPLSPKRLSARGFNQAELLAVEVGQILGLPVDKISVTKIRETGNQTGLSRKERQLNLKGAFTVCEHGNVRGKNIMLIDDVMTSGSTVENITSELRQSGAGRVFILTAAGGVFSPNTDISG